MTGAAQLALGTAQFGMAYGISGRGSAISPCEIQEILDAAGRRGICVLDTAPTYGDIEARLRDYPAASQCHVVSKIPALPSDADSIAAAEFVRRSIRQTRSRLGSRLDTILFHRGADLLGPQARAAWDAAHDEVAKAGVRLGASCYGPAEAIAINREFPIQVAQLPGNAFDQRLSQDRNAGKFATVEIHLRSVFLQGLLLLPVEKATLRVPKAAEKVVAWASWCLHRGMRPLSAALGVAKSLPGVRYCVVGVDCLSQFEEVADAWQSTEAIEASELATMDPDVIDPRRWGL